MSHTKYTVNYKGKIMTLGEFSKLTGIPYNTLRDRAMKHSDFYAPIPAKPIETIARRTKENYYNGYTFEELADLYKRFEGQENELRMVMDFTGLKKWDAAELLDKLRKNAEKNRKGYQP